MATKRVRTGCLKCRVRRRKCDEGKPKCQRCISGGFECQYGTRLSFLAKNSFTLDDPTSPTRSTPRSGYRKVQFVNAGTPSPNDASASSSLPGSDPPVPMQIVIEPGQSQDMPTQTLPHEASNAQPPANSLAEPSHGSSPKDSMVSRLMPPPQAPPLSHIEQQLSDPAFNVSFGTHDLESNTSGRYQDALDALLSLGADEVDGSSAVLQARQPYAQYSPVLFKPSPQTPDDIDREHRLQQLILSGELKGAVSEPSLGNTVSEERVLVLLKHWRYEVAPWLDLFDLGHGFGIYVSLLASHSKIVLDALVALSSASQDKHFGNAASSHSDDHIIPQAENSTTSVLRNGFDMSSQVKLLCIVLRSTRSVYRDSSSSGAALATVLDRYRLESSMTMVGTLGFQLLLRIELAAALIDERALPVSLYDLGVMPTPWHKSRLAQEVFATSMQALIYCIRALALAFGEVPVATPGDMVGAWLALIDDLNDWYLARTEEFQSLIETSDSDDGLPTILFTSGAGGFANQMYHTAMLLLLRHKPRTVQLTRHLKPSAASFLWHARRICGIALNNDLRECWDPCLVSSLVLAAKRMSHEDQHRTILNGLRRIGSLTKWDVSRYETILQAEWGS
ncbi:uncharacterized protein B0I36DRAFT_360085 [Microdochium trichocladiopsis]|uniref:Zn(2)-C6 fungal-type domain-containing protein n=1 Tax=Microdochium trichocladiopsis TaxID=1682393 RepID=A0A9P9BSH2_9PEZI|nr:uncharacterized protein B0I36DRAFT_360085 [Microdochium trichocladiopsis]KAH7034574.1 hypothetical protein B0I36DRAFT_360085 [Microdochium trichocladiopsis]